MSKHNVTKTKGVAKTPIVMQMEPLESGAAALSMVLAYYGKWLPLDEVRKDCGIGRNGASIERIAAAAQNYGLAVQVRKSSFDELCADVTFPCVALWEGGNYTVLCGFRGGKAVLSDPSAGSVALTIEEFEEAYGGAVMTLSPTEAFIPEGKQPSMWGYAAERLKGSGKAFALIVAASLILTVITMLNPAFSRVFLDRILSGANPGWLYPFLWVLFAVNILQCVVGLVREYYMTKIAGQFAVTASSKFIWHVLRLPVEFFSKRGVGDVLDRVEANEGMADTVLKVIAPLILDTIMLILYLLIMLQYSVALTLVGVAAFAINICVSQYVSRKTVDIARVISRDHGRYASITVSGLEMIETIKASGAENGFFQKWAGQQSRNNLAFVGEVKLRQSWGLVPEFVLSISNIFILVLGVVLVIMGQWTVGMILAFQGFYKGLEKPFSRILAARTTVEALRADAERIEDVMGYETDVEFDNVPYGDDVTFDKLSGNIEIKNVTFGYSAMEPPLIEDFSLTIKPGNKIAIVGFSGCGKSTLSKMISGLYKPWNGEIFYDGKTRGEIPREVFTGSLAVVDQDITLFEDTVADNIRMWDSSIEDFAVVVAARDAGMHEVIMQRKDGYDHKLVKGGADLSGGQRQRLEIARVLAQDPTVVIMDEATSALDAHTEFQVVESIQKRGITLIVIAHRLSTIRDADEIIVLDKGKAVERGTHEELFARGGFYTELVSNE